MPLNPKPQAHGKRKIQAGVSTGSSVSSLNLDGTTLQLNQSNSQPQRTVDLSSIQGDITGVTAGDGLTGGGNSGAVTLAVGVGTGLDVSADAVTLDLTEVGFGGGANRLVIDDGDGTVSTSANLTFNGTNQIDLVPSNADATLQLGAGNVVLQYSSFVGRLHSANRTLRMGNTGAEIKMLDGSDDKIELYTGGTSSTGTLGLSIDSSQNVIIPGNLTVQGTTTTIDSTTLSVKDKNIEMGVVSSPTDVTADGGGITLKGATDKTFNWIDSTDSWTASEHIELASGKSFRINGNNVLNQTTLGSTVVGSSLTSVGTLTSATISGDLVVDTDTLKVDTSNDRVGINVASPTDTLNIDTGQGVFDFKDFNMTYSTSLGIRAEGSGYLGLVTEGSNDVFISTNGFSNKRLVVKSDGKVGIGTTSPNSKMTVTGDLDIPRGSRFRAGSNDSNQGIDIYHNNDGSSAFNGNVVLEGRSSGGDIVFRNLDHGQDYKFYAENNSGTEQLIMKIDGTEAAVGIGEGSTGLTTANGAYLHVTGSSNLLANFLSSDGIGEIRVGDSSKYTRLLTAGNQFKIMPFDGVELMVLDGSTEKVGIGTNAPTEKLSVVGNIVASGSNRAIYVDPEFVVSGDNTYSMVSGSQGLAFYPNDSFTDFWVHSASRSVRYRAVASDGSFDNNSFLEIFPDSISATGEANANIRNSSGNLTLLTTGDDDIVLNSHDSLNLFFDNEYQIYSAADGNPRFMMRDATVASMEFDNSHNIKFKNATSTKMTLDTANGRLGIGTTPSTSLHIAGGGDQRVTLGSTSSNSSKLILSSDGGAERIDFSLDGVGNMLCMTETGRIGMGTTNPSTALHLSSATSSKPVVTIENTNADNNPPGLTFFKNTASPASSDQVGSIKFDSKEATSGDTKTYWEIQSRINDATNTTPNGQLNFYGLDGDSPGFIHQFQFINSQFSVLNSDGVGPTISPTGTNGGMFKTAGSKMRLQAKSDSTGEIHMMAHNVGINTTSPGARLHVSGNNSYDNTGGIRIGNSSTFSSIFMNNSAGGLEIDSPHSMVLDANRHMEFHAGGTTREHRYMYATTQYGFMTTADSNSYWAIGNKSAASAGLLLSGAAGGIRMVPANSTVTVKGNVDMENNGAVLFDNTNNNNQTFIRNGGTNAASLQFGVGTPSNSNTKIHLADDGKVGIGTTSPASKLHVAPSGSIANGISVGAAGNSGMYAFNATQMRFAVAGVDKLRVTASNAQFGSDGSWSPAVFVGTGSANPPNASNIAFKPLSDDTDTGYSRSADNTLALVAGGTQIMTATDSAVSIAGNLMFPDSNNLISALGSDNLYLRAHNDMYFNIDTPNDSTTRHFIWRNNTSNELMRLGEDGILEVKGDVGIGTAAPSEHLHVESASNTQALFKSTDNRGLIQVADDDTTASIVAENSTLSLGLTSQIATTNINIDTDGKLGIGITDPVRYLDVNSGGTDIVGRFTSTDNRATIQLSDNDTNRYISTEGSAISIGPNSSLHTNNLNIVGSPAKIGIGTTSPTQPLTIVTANNDEGILLDCVNDSHEARIIFGDTSSNAAGHMAYNHSLDALRFHTNGGSEALRLESDQDAKFFGKLGIGTTPSTSLHIAGSGDQRITLGSTSANSSRLILSSDGGSERIDFSLDGVGNMLAMTETGRIGIGTTSPSNLLHLKGGKLEIEKSDSSKHLLIDENSIRTTTTNDLSIFTNGNSDQLVLDQGGNVGIGTNAPGEKLHVAGTGRFTDSISVGTTTQPTSTGISVSTTIQVAERSSAPSHVESSGILWVKNDNPTNLYFTDDDGNDIALTNNGSAAGGGGGSGTINSGIANSFAVYAADGTTLSDSIFSGSEPDGSLTYDLSSFPKLRLFREDGSTGGTNGFGVIEFGNTEFSSDRSSANAHIQVVGGGVDQDPSSNGGCIMNFKTLKNSETGTPQTRLKITADGVTKLIDDTGGASENPSFSLYRSSQNPADNNYGASIVFHQDLDGTTEVETNAITVRARDVTTTSKDTQIILKAYGANNYRSLIWGSRDVSASEAVLSPEISGTNSLGHPSYPFYRLYLGNTGATPLINIDGNDGATASVNFANSSAQQLSIETKGGVVLAAVVLGSDKRLKTNISKFDKGLSLINQLTPKKFKYNKDYRDELKLKNVDNIGFIAQDLEKISSDYVDNKEIMGEERLQPSNIFTQEMNAALVNAIKELSAKNDALEARIKELESKL